MYGDVRSIKITKLQHRVILSEIEAILYTFLLGRNWVATPTKLVTSVCAPTHRSRTDGCENPSKITRTEDWRVAAAAPAAAGACDGLTATRGEMIKLWV